MKNTSIRLRLRSLAALLVTAAAVPAFASDIATVRVDMSKAETQVDMNFLDGANLRLPAGEKPSVVLFSEVMASCSIESIKKSARGWKISVAFEAELEDGLNYCDLALLQDENQTKVRLFVDVLN